MKLALTLAAIHILWVAACLLGLRVGIWAPMGVAAFIALGLWSRLVPRPQSWVPRLDDVVIGLAAGALLAGATLAAYPALAEAIPGLAVETRALYARLNTPPGPMGVLPVFVAIMVAEEVVWRDAVVRALNDKVTSRPLAYAVSTGLYALAQGGQLSLAVVGVAAMVGTVFAALACVRQGRLAAPILAHVVWDLAVMVMWPLEVASIG